MMRDLATAELFVMALTSFALASSVICWLIAPAALARLHAWQPAKRHTALWLLCATPVALTAVLCVASIWPALSSMLDPALDHCLVHDDGHAHLCFVHASSHGPHAMLWLGVLVLATLVGFRAAASLVRAVRSTRVVGALVRTGTADRRTGAVVLEDSTAICITAGLLHPRVLVSRGLLHALSEIQQQALFAHEHSHARRRDALSHLVAGLLSRAYPPALRARLLRALEVAAEQACDEAAAVAVQDRLVVADTILAVQRASEQSGCWGLGSVAVGMGQLAIESRVQSLLHSPVRTGALGATLSLVAAAAIGLFSQADLLHHLVESCLSPLLH